MLKGLNVCTEHNGDAMSHRELRVDLRKGRKASFRE